MGVCRRPTPPSRGQSAGKALIWARMSGEALNTNQRSWSALMAIDDCVLEWHGREPSRAARQFGQPQFHCGKPPPAAEPRTRTHTALVALSSAEAELLHLQTKMPRRCPGAAHYTLNNRVSPTSDPRTRSLQ